MIKRFINDLKKYIHYAVRATKADLKTEVSNSYLNWIWWVLQPICFMLIYVLVFGVFFGMKENYIACFVFMGITIWNFFNNTIKASVKIVRANKSVISKVYLPKFILILVEMMTNGFKMAISFLIIIVLMIIYGVPLSWNIFMIIPILIILFLFTYAISCFLMHFGVYVTDLKNIVDIVLRLLFYLTGVFYNIMKRIPDPYNEWLVRLNPIAMIIYGFRQSVLNSQMPDLLMLGIWFVVSLLLAAWGTYVVYKNENSYIKSV